MRNKNISFAQVLKRKNKLNSTNNIKAKFKLSNYLQEWQSNPDDTYTLYLDQSKNNNNRSIHQISVISKAESNEELFDSWIQKQGNVGNKENVDFQPNRYDRNAKNNFQKPIVLNQKKRQVKENIIKGNQIRFSQIKNQNYSRNNPLEIDINISRQFSKNSCLVNKSKSPMSGRVNESSLLVEEDSRDLRYQRKDVNSFKLPKEPLKSQNNEVRGMKKIDTKFNEVLPSPLQISRQSIKQNQIQQIINATDHIHIEIAELAHQYVLQQKKALEQQQLLISIEQKKQQSKEFREMSKVKKIQQSKGDAKIDQNLRQQVKKQVGNLLKTFNSKKSIPNFGQINENSQQPVFSKLNSNKNDKPIKMFDDKNINSPCLVGYSFSTKLQNQIQSEAPQIPLLSIPEQPSPTIPHIAEIQSERHPSESNEQIYDIYQKWKKQNIPLFQKDCQNVHHIASVHYHQQDNIQQQNQKTEPNEPKQLHPLINNTFGKSLKQINLVDIGERQLTQQQSTDQRYSKYIPEIMVEIPKNYEEINDKQSQIDDYNTSQNRYQQHQTQKKQVLCLSASPPQHSPQMEKNMNCQTPLQLEIELEPNATSEKKIIILSNKSNKSQQLKNQKNISHGKRPVITPSRQTYLEQEESQQITTDFETQTIQEDQHDNNHLQIKNVNEALQIQDLKDQKAQKQKNTEFLSQQPNSLSNKPQKLSPKQFNNFCLNKVYSSPKETNSKALIPKQTISTTDFTPQIKIQKQQKPTTIPYVAMKYEGGKFQFAHHSDGQSNEGETTKPAFDKKTEIYKPALLFEKQAHKIESYAYPISSNQQGYLKNSEKEEVAEQKEQFNFDF